MPTDHRDDAARHSVVPSAARRSLWFAAVWTGVGAAVVCAALAVVAVAICWLPTSGGAGPDGATGRVHSTIHAGLLTFLASVHGGITVDATAATFLPLGLLLVVGLTAWRAGAGLADAAGACGEGDPLRLALAGLAQAATFAVACMVAAPFATLGTSSAPILRVGAAALVVFAIFGGAALACYSPLSDWCSARVPPAARHGIRAAGAVLAVYLAAGALLFAASLAVHHGQVTQLSRHVGDGWGGVPVLALGLLAVPNAVIAAVGYLAGPGFALGAATTVGPFGAAHGTLPAFPILGAVPSGDGAGHVVWLLMALTALVAGSVLARSVWRLAGGWRERVGAAASALAAVATALIVLAWQGGGGVGAGGLAVVGVSPWRLGLLVAAVVGAVCVALCGLALGVRRWQVRMFRRESARTERVSDDGRADGEPFDYAPADADLPTDAEMPADADARDEIADPPNADLDTAAVAVTERLPRIDAVGDAGTGAAEPADDPGEARLAG